MKYFSKHSWNSYKMMRWIERNNCKNVIFEYVMLKSVGPLLCVTFAADVDCGVWTIILFYSMVWTVDVACKNIAITLTFITVRMLCPTL